MENSKKVYHALISSSVNPGFVYKLNLRLKQVSDSTKCIIYESALFGVRCIWFRRAEPAIAKQLYEVPATCFQVSSRSRRKSYRILPDDCQVTDLIWQATANRLTIFW